MTGLIVIVLQIGGALLYGYTLYLAYTISGLMAAVVSAMFPGVSNLYWIYDRWSVTGDFLNFYTSMNLLWLAVYAFAIVVLGLSTSLSSRNNAED
jgi:hypothetical protein